MWTCGLEHHATKKCEICIDAIPFVIQRSTRDIITAPQENSMVKLTLATELLPGINDYCSISEDAYVKSGVVFTSVMGRMVLPWDMRGICDSCWFNKKGKSYNERNKGHNK
jgi:hypothetical protein